MANPSPGESCLKFKIKNIWKSQIVISNFGKLEIINRDIKLEKTYKYPVGISKKLQKLVEKTKREILGG